MAAPDSVMQLVDTFSNNLDFYKSGKYNEAQLRQEFLDPFFRELGWDMDNAAGLAPQYRDVIHEASIKIGSSTKAPDYAFSIHGQYKFFLEAKKPSVNIHDDTDPAYQLRRYGWSAKLPVSILTDFEEFAIYDCRIKPKRGERASNSRLNYFKFTDYVERWDELFSTFSKDAILKGSFDKYTVDTKRHRGTSTVDDAFLEEIENWRNLLARNFALRNPQLSVRDLNFAVQKTIDRIIFLRICEDRGTEDYKRLASLLRNKSIYSSLLVLFREADARYNSGLFHFGTEKGRTNPDNLTPNLDLDDKVLKEIISKLYYPESPYEFSVLPADILGHVYEQFLGKTINLTHGHRAKIEEKPEVRKAGGVYYTPSYIVDYIVKNTIGRLLDGIAPENYKPITIPKAAEIKVLDPACGSGSFLIVAYQYLLDWHLRQYTAESDSNEPDEGKIKRHSSGKHPKIYQAPGGEWKLTTSERKRILLNNIHGVDIDAQAVEVTKLSLLLKVLEGETQQVQQRDWIRQRERILPNLDNNIKCGNSLIGPDFYNNEKMLLLDEETQYKINVFDWNTAFPEIMKHGGFACIIGNPPWGAQIQKSVNRYLAGTYARVVDRMVDTYIYFIDKSLQISKKNGMIGLVIPATLLNQSDTKSVRRILAMQGVSSLLNLGSGIFGKGATNTTLALIACKDNSPDYVYLQDLQHAELTERKKHLSSGSYIPYPKWKSLVNSDPLSTFFVSAIQSVELLSKLRDTFPEFSTILENGIQRGVTPDCAEMHLISSLENSDIETNVLRKSLSGDQIHRFLDAMPNCWLIYTTKQTDALQCPKAIAHMEAFRSRLTCKEIRAEKHSWWRLHRPRNPLIFDSPKFIGVTTSRKIEVVFDESNDLVVTDGCYVFKTIGPYDHHYILGILHSRLFDWMYKTSNQGDGRVIPQVKAAKLSPIPIRSINFENIDDLEKHNNLVGLVKRMLLLNRKKATESNPETMRLLEMQVTATSNLIDRLVYELYRLTDEQIKLVEQ